SEPLLGLFFVSKVAVALRCVLWVLPLSSFHSSTPRLRTARYFPLSSFSMEPSPRPRRAPKNSGKPASRPSYAAAVGSAATSCRDSNPIAESCLEPHHE